jgi:hypothetical protein
MAVAACINGDYGFNECSRVYRVPRATIRRLAMKKNWYVNGLQALERQARFFEDMEEILADHIIMLEALFLALKTFES